MADVKVFQEKSSSMVQPEESGAIIKDILLFLRLVNKQGLQSVPKSGRSERGKEKNLKVYQTTVSRTFF